MTTSFEECLSCFWDELKKKRQTRELFCDLYGSLVQQFSPNHAELAELCSKTSDWPAHAEKLRRCIGSGVLGKKLFSGLQQYICGAQVEKMCFDIFNKWEEAQQEITQVVFEEAIATISAAVALVASEITDGLKWAIELEVGNLKFQMLVSSSQEDIFPHFLY